VELQHRFTVPAPVGTTWDTFMDLAGVAACFPGATVTSVEGDRFEGTCKVKLGPIALMYAGSGQFVTRDDDAHRATIEAMGKDKRGNGTAGAKVTIALDEAADDSTAVAVTTDLSITGKPAQFGRGVMQDVSDKLLQQFVACLEQRLSAPEAEVAVESVESVEALEEVEPTPSESATGSAAASVDAAVGSEAAAPAAPAAAAPAAAAPAPPPRSNVAKPAFVRASAGGDDDAIDLGSTVLPVILKAYAPQLATAAVALVVGILIGRRSRR
jgi:carbon monoxide dehydrogenase subunit G